MDKLRTAVAEFIVGRLRHANPLVIRAWFCLAAKTEDPDEKRHCLEAVLQLNPESQSARAGLALLHQREVSGRGEASIADDSCRC